MDGPLQLCIILGRHTFSSLQYRHMLTLHKYCLSLLPTFFTRTSLSWWKSLNVEDTKMRTVFHPWRLITSFALFFSFDLFTSIVLWTSSHCALTATTYLLLLLVRAGIPLAAAEEPQPIVGTIDTGSGCRMVSNYANTRMILYQVVVLNLYKNHSKQTPNGCLLT